MSEGKGNGKATENAQPVRKESVLRIEFSFVGSADFTLQQENVTPAQILAAAGYLEWYAKMQFDMQVAQQMQAAQQKPRIAVPLQRM